MVGYSSLSLFLLAGVSRWAISRLLFCEVNSKCGKRLLRPGGTLWLEKRLTNQQSMIWQVGGEKPRPRAPDSPCPPKRAHQRSHLTKNCYSVGEMRPKICSQLLWGLSDQPSLVSYNSMRPDLFSCHSLLQGQKLFGVLIILPTF